MSVTMIFISAILVNNIVLSQFLGICPFLGVSKKISTAVGMGLAVMFVMTISSVATYLIYYRLLVPYHLEFMNTVVFILVIAALVQMVEIIIKKVSPALYQALGIYLPLITTNCAVLGVAILSIQKGFSLSLSVCFGLANAAGSAVDGMDVPYLVGSLAGDDTALLIMRDTESALDFTEEIKEMLR